MDFYGTMLVKKSNNEDISLLGANDLAFKKCLENTLMDVTADMLDGVSNVRSYAFYRCSYLENIEIPSSVISIGHSAFYECTGLKNVTIQPGISLINNNTFYGCSALENITIPEGVESIGSNAFYQCSSLESIDFPSGITSIGSYAFESSGLVSLEIPQGLEEIGYYVFMQCENLERVVLPDSVTRISSQAFSGCLLLESVTIHATTPPNLEYNVFSNTPNTLKIYVPAASVDAYKAARNWSTYASQIEAIPNN